MVVFPNCKINLGLDILRRRHDGYHDIATVMVPVPWHDILEVVPVKSGVTTLTVTGRGVDCPPEKNLVMKAYRALADHVGGLPQVDIYLHKVIPDGAGLGGGSADASFTLQALNSLFELGIDDAELAEIAAHIGADCPFFIYNRPMLAEGIGEKLTPIDVVLDGMEALLIKPPVSVSTAQAYAGVTPQVPPTPLADRILQPIEAWQADVVNAFEHSVFGQLPILADIKQQLLQYPGVKYVSMSGSGSTVFALAPRGTFAQNELPAEANADGLVTKYLVF